MLKVFATTIVVLAASATASQALAAAQDFTFHNQSSKVVASLYISATNESKWGEDVLGRDVLQPGESTHIQFSGYGDQCDFDIKVVDANGAETVENGMNLCTLTDVSYH